MYLIEISIVQIFHLQLLMYIIKKKIMEYMMRKQIMIKSNERTYGTVLVRVASLPSMHGGPCI